MIEELPEMIVGVLREGRSVSFTARGGSMWPAVRDGAFVRVEPDRGVVRALRPGDLGCFARGGRPVVHRVVKTSPRGVTFAGDALTRDDGEASWGDVLGAVTVVKQPALRWWALNPCRTLRGMVVLRRVCKALLAGRAFW